MEQSSNNGTRRHNEDDQILDLENLLDNLLLVPSQPQQPVPAQNRRTRPPPPRPPPPRQPPPRPPPPRLPPRHRQYVSRSYLSRNRAIQNYRRRQQLLARRPNRPVVTARPEPYRRQTLGDQTLQNQNVNHYFLSTTLPYKRGWLGSAPTERTANNIIETECDFRDFEDGNYPKFRTYGRFYDDWVIYCLQWKEQRNKERMSEEEKEFYKTYAQKCNCAVSEVDDRWRGVKKKINEEMELLSNIWYCIEKRRQDRKKYFTTEVAQMQKYKKEHEKLLEKISTDPSRAELKDELIDVERMMQITELRLQSLTKQQIALDNTFIRQRISQLEEALKHKIGWIYLEEDNKALQHRKEFLALQITFMREIMPKSAPKSTSSIYFYSPLPEEEEEDPPIDDEYGCAVGGAPKDYDDVFTTNAKVTYDHNDNEVYNHEQNATDDRHLALFDKAEQDCLLEGQQGAYGGTAYPEYQVDIPDDDFVTGTDF